MRTKVLEDAAIVCSTLSFSGSGAFGQMARAFDVVIIDEAAQAVEPSILIPLTAGCKQVIKCHDQLTNLQDARGANPVHVSARALPSILPTIWCSLASSSAGSAVRLGPCGATVHGPCHLYGGTMLG